MQPLSEFGGMSGLLAKLEARKRWEADNPELAQAWNWALEEDAQRAVVLAEAERVRRNRGRLDALLGRCGVPQAHIAAVLSGVATNDHAKTTALTWAKQREKPFLAILGQNGRGKTTRAVMAMGEVLVELEGRPRSTGQEFELGCFVHSSSLASLSSFDGNDRSFFERLQRCKVLLVDDLGTEHLTANATALFESLLDIRGQRNARTIFTTNLDGKGFRARYGERMADRIRGWALFAQCAGVSFRQPDNIDRERGVS